MRQIIKSQDIRAFQWNDIYEALAITGIADRIDHDIRAEFQIGGNDNVVIKFHMPWSREEQLRWAQEKPWLNNVALALMFFSDMTYQQYCFIEF